VTLVVFVKECGFVAQVVVAVDAIDGDVVVGGNIPTMTRAGVGNGTGILDGLFTKAYRGHDIVLRFSTRIRSRTRPYANS
jgi:hypothetical protein